MIAYEILCQSIEDWRAGRRPTAHIPGPAQAPSPYEHVDSGVVEMDDEEMQVEMEGYEAGAPGEQMGPTGTPPAYTTDMPPPYDTGQPAPYTEMIPTHEESEDVEIAEDDEPR